jgi:hypothetical protein
MKKLLFLGACLVALASSPVMAQTGGADVVTVRVVEEVRHSRLWINWPGREPELIEFEWNDKEGKGANAGKGYEAAVNKLYLQGYHLQGVIPGLALSGPGFYTQSTLVFIKDK